METFLLVAIVVVALAYFLVLPPRTCSARPKGTGRERGERRVARRARSESPASAARTELPPEAALDETRRRRGRSQRTRRRCERARPGAPAARCEPTPQAARSRRPSSRRARCAAPTCKTLRRGLARSRDSGGVFGRLKALFGGERQIDAGLAQRNRGSTALLRRGHEHHADAPGAPARRASTRAS